MDFFIRINKSLKKNGFLNTFKFFFINILKVEIKRIPREHIMQIFARRNYMKENIILPDYMKSHRIQKTNFLKNNKWMMGLPNYLDYLDQNNLLKNIYINKPKIVLEIGSGYSTYSIIHALMNLKKKENHNFKFYCIDQSKEYLDVIIKNMPEEYKNHIIFLHREIYVEEFNGQKMSFFDIPDEDYDFIYEDRKDHPETKLAGDIIKFEHTKLNKDKNFYFTIDGMVSTANYYKKNLKYNYKFSKNYVHGINFKKL